VHEGGQVENRVIEVPAGLPPSALTQASNYLNARLAGRTLEETRTKVSEEIAADRSALDALTQQVISAGLATWSGGGGGSLILRGQSRLLQNLDQAAQVKVDLAQNRVEVQTHLERVKVAEAITEAGYPVTASRG
jgi:heat-inducible transcriptional repressor